jgi:hypothetical protein
VHGPRVLGLDEGDEVVDVAVELVIGPGRYGPVGVDIPPAVDAVGKVHLAVGLASPAEAGYRAYFATATDLATTPAPRR